MTHTHTPGPWYWDINRRNRTIRLWGGNRLVVMDFSRWGMQAAQPRFSDRPDEKHGGIMWNAEDFDAGVVDGYKSISDHPDARLIAQAPNLLFSCRWLRDMLNAARETLNDAGVAHDLDGDFDAALEDANTAIAKAGWIEREQENQG